MFHSRPRAKFVGGGQLIQLRSVRSREGRRNRAPPPRIRYNKDGKKINPNQAAAKTTTA